MSEKRKLPEGTKTFTVYIPRDLWLFLKDTAAHQERCMRDIVCELIEKYKNKLQ